MSPSVVVCSKGFVLCLTLYSDLCVIIHWNAVKQCFTVEPFIFIFYKFVILENLSILNLAFLGVEGFSDLSTITLRTHAYTH